MNLLAFIDPSAPVRLVTGVEAPRVAAASLDHSMVAWIATGVGAFIVGVVAIGYVKWRRTRTDANLDQAAGFALARRLGLSRRERGTLWDLAKNDAQHSPLDLLVSVKALSAAASRRAESLTDDMAREALCDLCRALDAQPPAFAPSDREKAPRGPRTRVGAAKTPSRGPSRPSVESPRLIDRRG